jgi:hypothetical protein
MAAEDSARPVADGFLRFLIPAPKPRRSPAAPATAAAARVVPPHRLVAPPPAIPVPRPEERLHIVPPTRPEWLPPWKLPPPPPPPPTTTTTPTTHHSPSPGGSGAGARPRTFPPAFDDPRARNAGRFSGGRGDGARGRSLGAAAHNGGAGAGRSGPQRPKAAAAAAAVRKEKKAWVAVEKKGDDAGDEDRAAGSEGYSGGDEAGTEAEDQLEPEGEQGTRGRLEGLDREDDANNSLPMAANQECSGGGGDGDEGPSEVGRSTFKLPSWQCKCTPWIDRPIDHISFCSFSC